MSESKRKKDRYTALLSNHAYCCFCGGVRRSATIDHVPARIFFRKKIGPEDFEFPACQECNAASSLSEQIAALYTIICTRDEGELDPEDLNKRITAIANNAPECIPILSASVRQKREMLRQKRIQRHPGQFLSEIPVAAVQKEVHCHFELVNRKLLAALFYKETNIPLDQTNMLITYWDQLGSPGAKLAGDRATEWFGAMIVGYRRNTDIGAQFLYKFGYSDAHGFFGTWVELGGTFGILCIAGPAEQMAKLNNNIAKRWVPIDQFGRDVRAGKSGAS